MAEITYREALNQALKEEMARDDAVFLMGEEVAEYDGAYKVSRGLLDQFGDRRVVDSPISELGFAGLGVGAAMVGLRPVIEFMTFNFSYLALDQVINTAAKWLYMSNGQIKVPIVFRGPNGSALQLSAQHSQACETYYSHAPGCKVVTPGTPADAKGLLKSAIRGDDPVIYFEHKRLYRWIKEELPEEDFTVPIGKGIVRKEGKDLTIVCYGLMYHRSMQAAESLQKDGIDAEVIDMRSLRPWDRELILESVKKTSRALLVQESSKTGGVMAEVSATITEEIFDSLDAPVTRVCGLDVPAIPFAPPMEHFFLPNAEKIARAAKKIMEY